MRALFGSLAALAAVLLAQNARAEGFSLNYASLSTLEEPLAFRSGQTTLVVNGVVDGGARINFDTNNLIDPVDAGVVANGQATVETELGNRWTVGASYFGQYDTYAHSYRANTAGFIRTSWGTLIGGNVGGVLREDTRRRRGFGLRAVVFVRLAITRGRDAAITRRRRGRVFQDSAESGPQCICR